MKIGIDARFLGPEGTGIGRYIEELLKNLQKLDKKNEYFVILKKSNFYLFDAKADNFTKLITNVRYYSLSEQLLVPAALVKIKPDLVHFPHFNVPLIYPGKFVVTIHDIIKSEFKGTASTTRSLPVYLLKHFAYEMSIAQAAKRAKKIIVPSNFIKKKVIKAFGLKESKVRTIYEAVDNSFVELGRKKIPDGREKQLLATYGIKKPFIIYVGNAYPHKNLNNLVSALPLIDKKIQLVCVSSRNFFIEKLVATAREMGLERRLIVTGFVPNEDLVLLYKLASCFVFPSFSEGFGLPGLEAMASGCPLLASDIEVFREIYGDAATYFDPKVPKDIARKIELIIKNPELRSKQLKKGFDQVRKYSWEKTAEETLKVYESAV